MQQGVQTDAACNIQQCCVRLHVTQLKLCICLRKRSLPEHRTHCLNYKSSLRYKRTALCSHEQLWDSFIIQTWKFSNWIVLASNTSFIPPRIYLSLVVLLYYRTELYRPRIQLKQKSKSKTTKSWYSKIRLFSQKKCSFIYVNQLSHY